MKTALLLIATGQKYRDYAKKLMVSADEFFVPHDTIIFTDDTLDFTDEEGMGRPGITTCRYDYQGYPQASYRRYHAFSCAWELLSTYDYVFYCDVDMRFVAPIEASEICSNGITATEHPGYVGLTGTPERRKESTAYCALPRTYFCGGFNGGATGPFLSMARTIKMAIDEDDKNGVQAVWVDESHLNRYLFDNPPSKILSPSFCYPEGAGEHYQTIWARAGRTDITPRLVALEKGPRC